MISLRDAKELRHGDRLYHATHRDSRGRPQEWRVAGVPKVWKRSPDRVEVPVKWGLNTWDRLTENDLELVYHTPEEAMRDNTTAKEAVQLLPGKIKVRLEEDWLDCLTVSPVEEWDQLLVSITNEYNGSHEIFAQNQQEREDLLTNLPRKALFRVRQDDADHYGAIRLGRYWYAPNSGAEFYMDSWEFRQMVGGQSD